MAHHSMPEHSPDLYREVQARFADMPNVVVTQGKVPDSLTNAPDKIAFLHIDMNNVAAEIGALDTLFDRMVPGGVLIFDDFGWLAYRRQQEAEIAWFAQRGYSILELATGQGMVIK
jgi:predicted O-methyltransferase YrrM